MEVGVDQGYAKLDALLASDQTAEGQTAETAATTEGAEV
jgi:hypothetical protein